MKASTLFLAVFVCLGLHLPTTNAQTKQLTFTSSTFHPTYQIPWYGELEPTTHFNETEFISTYTRQYLSSNVTFQEIKRSSDDIGFTHIRYQQFIDTIKVQHGVLILHLKENVVESFNGELYITQRKSQDVLSYEEILSEIKPGKYPFPKEFKIDSTHFEKSLIYCPSMDGNSIELGYQYFLKSVNPAKEDLFYIDATKANIIRIEPQLIHSDSVGKARTYYRGTQTITTDFVGTNSFRMKENARPINTYETSLGNYVTDADNYWTTSGKEIAGDVHYGAEKVYEFMDSMFNWNSYANNADSISSVLNYSGGANAFWNLADNYATFLVAKSGNVLPCASLDVVGHEFGHGIADENAGLVYSGEACMLHESFADITGAAIEFFEDSAKSNWLLGEQVWVSSSGIRNMSNPKAFNHPDTYKGTFWGSGCHGNGGVLNYWFYLMVAGDTGTNDNNVQYSINGLGRDSAIQVMYRAMFYYVTPNTKFKDMATYTLKAAKDLYGSCGHELQETWDAWEAVGIVDTSVNLINLEHGIIAPKLRCTSLPADQFFESKGDPSRIVRWDIGGIDTANTHSVKMKFTEYDQYTVLLLTNVCDQVFYDTLKYRINPQPEASFDLNRLEFCKGFEDSLVATNTTIDLDKKQQLLHKWRVEPYDIEATSRDFTLSLKDKSYFFSIELESYYKTGCSSKLKEFVTPVEVAMAQFSAKSVCKDEPIPLRNLTDTTRGVRFIWTFTGLNSGDKQTSVDYEPNEEQTNLEDIEVRLTVTDTATKCVSTVKDTITVNALPNPTFDYNKACYKDTITLINTTSHNAKVTWFKWDFGFYEPFNKDTVTYVITSQDSLIVGLEVRDDNQCKVKAFKTIPIETIQVYFSDSIACQNAELAFNNTTVGSDLFFQWTFEDGTTINEKDAFKTFDTHGKTEVTLSAFSSHCQSTFSKELDILPAPEIIFDYDGTCVGSPTSFINNTNYADTLSTYNWNFADGTTSNEKSPSHQYTSTTTETYFVQLEVENSDGCKSSKNKPVTINSLPHCGFTWSYSWPTRSVLFVPDSSEYKEYLWNFDSDNSSQLKTPEHTFDNDASYNVQLTIVDKYGCSCSQTEKVDGSNLSLNKVVDATSIHLYPNPNIGSFKITSDLSKITTLRIVDIHGREVFTVSSPSSNMIETSIQASGVYFAQIQLEDDFVTVPFIVKVP